MKARLLEHRKLIVALCLVVGLFNVVANAFVPADWARTQLPWMLGVIPMFLVAAVLVIRVETNMVGWLLLTVATAGSFGTFQGFAALDGWLAAGGAALSTFGITMLTVLLLLFPDGSVLSPRWRPAVALGITTATLGGIVAFLSGGWGGEVAGANILSPLYESTRSFTEVAVNVYFPMYSLSLLAALASLVVRYRRGSADARHQVKWLLSGVAFLFLSLLLGLAGEATGGAAGWVDILLAVGIGSVPVAIGIAVLRYRLYDIDVVIAKSFTYLGLAGVITLLYAAVVVGPLLVIGHSSEGGPGLALPIAATAFVAVLFEPIRSRTERWANRLVYGKRSTPHEVLSKVASRLSETSTGSGTSDLASLLAEGTGASQAVVWLRSGETLQPEGVWSSDEPSEVAPVLVSDLVADDFTATTPVLLGDQILGALSITKPRNDPITPADAQLLSDVAPSAGLLLKNISLNQELVDRAREVRASRQRLIAAQDAERHRLERDLHDGAQQQVVALKVKLGIARAIATREEAHEVATQIDRLADETQQAVDALRGVAHGIYPPLLESEGLETALRAVERSSAIPLTIDTKGLTRYSPEVEQTMYFCLIETLDRAYRSGAKQVQLEVRSHNNQLAMVIDLDGETSALDLTAVRDRVDAAGGTTNIEHRPDGGNRIISAIPASQRASKTT